MYSRTRLTVGFSVAMLALAGLTLAFVVAARGASADGTTPSQTEGPYYKPGSPERTSLLEPDLAGTKLVLSGHVLTTDGQPIARTWLDFWQADTQGVYDNDGYRLRGHQFTDDAGTYALETIVPRGYFGRTEHIHVKLQAPDQPVLTTQLYFPDQPGNRRDPIFNSALILSMQDTNDGPRATYDFVLNVASR